MSIALIQEEEKALIAGTCEEGHEAPLVCSGVHNTACLDLHAGPDL